MQYYERFLGKKLGNHHRLNRRGIFLLQSVTKVKIHETRRVGILLAFVGGFLDVNTYLLRGGVFANAQTGNMVLLMLQISEGQWMKALYYIIPIIAFFSGVVVTELVKLHERWHEYVLIIEIVLLFLIGFYPVTFPAMIVNVTISFICALQISSFRKLRGAVYATTVYRAIYVQQPNSLLCFIFGAMKKQRKSV